MKRIYILFIAVSCFYMVNAQDEIKEITTEIFNEFIDGNTPFANGEEGLKYEIPGKVELEWLDLGEKGESWIETDAHTGVGDLTFRADECGAEVDFERKTYTDDPFGRTENIHIGFFSPGEWYEYTVDVTERAIYQVSGIFSTHPGISFVIYVNDTLHTIGESVITFPGTSDWNLWMEEIFVEKIKIDEGEYTLRIKTIEGLFNLDFLTFENVGEWPEDNVAVENTKNSSFDVYPNPATNEINIANIALNSEIRLINLTGQVQFVTIAETENVSIDISELKSGMYLLQANGSIRKITIK